MKGREELKAARAQLREITETSVDMEALLLLAQEKLKASNGENMQLAMQVDAHGEEMDGRMSQLNELTQLLAARESEVKKLGLWVLSLERKL